MSKKITVIGSGFSGLAAATVLAKHGHEVTIFERHDQTGGRARVLREKGYNFDMGPSWYWMPDVFEDYFNLFGKKAADFYELKLLDPAFTIFFGKGDSLDIPASLEAIYELFEKEEKNGAAKLKKFLAEAELKYKLAMGSLVYLPAESITEYLNTKVLRNMASLDIFRSFRSHAHKYFKSHRLLQLIEFPVLFLGGTATSIPALYSMMNYAAFNLSTWYPIGGFSKITDAMTQIAEELGITIHKNDGAKKIIVSNDRADHLITHNHIQKFDALVASSDYHHTEQLLDEHYRNYDEKYWNRKTFAPSCLIFYVGVSKKIKGLNHHNLFFDEDLDRHAHDIYTEPRWPEHPLFYICCTSKTDESTAPEGHENLFILMPLAAGIGDDEHTREDYFNLIIKRLEHVAGVQIAEHIEYKKSYCVNDFVADYSAYKGNAYGLANTLRQTAILRPSIKNKKLNNLFYTGHLTVPGPGVPPAIISGRIAAEQVLKTL